VQYEPASHVSQPLTPIDQQKVQTLATGLTSAPRPPQSDSGHINLRSDDAQSPEDTIFIDREGTLHHSDEKAEPTP
jgi:hypothetical protein